MSIDRILQEIKNRYQFRADAREKNRKKAFKKGSVSIVMNKSLKKEPKEFVTINHAAVPIGDDGHLMGEVGEKIENAEKKSDTQKEAKPDENPVESSKKTAEGKDKVASKENTPQPKKKTERQRKFEEDQKRLRNLVEDGFKSGRFSEKYDSKKQGSHFFESDEYNKRIAKGDDPSYITIPEEEMIDLVNKNIHTGKVIEHFNDEGEPSYRVYFETDKIIGTCVRPESDYSDRDTTDVMNGEIHLSKTGWHVIPVMKKRWLS